MSEETRPIYERGDVVYGDDPFKGSGAGRPWLVVTNHDGRPFHGEQYIGVTLTTRDWMDGYIEIPAECWIRGGTPEDSRIVPWAVQSIAHEDIAFWQGRVESDLVDDAVAALVAELR